jgi:hypothetical protein
MERSNYAVVFGPSTEPHERPLRSLTYTGNDFSAARKQDYR